MEKSLKFKYNIPKMYDAQLVSGKLMERGSFIIIIIFKRKIIGLI